MKNKTTNSGNDFRPHGTQRAGARQPSPVPAFTPAGVQPKMAAGRTAPPPPSAPPVYRPQPVPKVSRPQTQPLTPRPPRPPATRPSLQPKMNGVRGASPGRAALTPTPPPAYGPRVPNVLQANQAEARARIAGHAANQLRPAAVQPKRPAGVNPPPFAGGRTRLAAASVQLKHAPSGGCCQRHASVVQLQDPKYQKPQGYDKVAAPKESYNYQLGKSQVMPDTQTTYATAKLNGWYLGKSQSQGEHAEGDVIAHVQRLCDSTDGALLPKGQKNKLSIHLNKSPCTSTSRDSLPKTRDDGSPGCTERLIDLATNGYKGHQFYIRLKVQNLYQPQIKGAKNASKRALVALEAAGISVIGYNRDYRIEKVEGGTQSHRGEPLSPYNIVEDDDFEYNDTQKKQLKKQWESVSTAVGKIGVYKWQDNS